MIAKGRQSLRMDPNIMNDALAHASTARINRYNSVESVDLGGRRNLSDDMLIENQDLNDVFDNINVEQHERRKSVESVKYKMSVNSITSKEMEHIYNLSNVNENQNINQDEIEVDIDNIPREPKKQKKISFNPQNNNKNKN